VVAITSKAFLFNFYLDIHFSSFYTSSQRACLLDGGVELGKFSNKLTAFLVVMAFFSVLQLSAFAGNEVAAGKNSASLEKNSSDEFPQVGAEKESASPTIKKKHSALPWILGGLAVATGVVLALTVFKKKSEEFDIRGNWDVNYTISNTIWPCHGTLSFTGSPSAGKVFATLLVQISEDGLVNSYMGSGDFSINKNRLTFSWHDKFLPVNFSFVASVVDSKSINGTVVGKLDVSGGNPVELLNGVWVALKK